MLGDDVGREGYGEDTDRYYDRMLIATTWL